MGFPCLGLRGSPPLCHPPPRSYHNQCRTPVLSRARGVDKSTAELLKFTKLARSSRIFGEQPRYKTSFILTIHTCILFFTHWVWPSRTIITRLFYYILFFRTKCFFACIKVTKQRQIPTGIKNGKI